MNSQTPDQRIRALEVSVAELKFLTPQVKAMDEKIDKVFSFIDKHEAIEEEREKAQELRHQENSARLQEISNGIARKSLITTIVSLIWAAAGVAVTIASVWKIGH